MRKYADADENLDAVHPHAKGKNWPKPSTESLFGGRIF